MFLKHGIPTIQRDILRYGVVRGKTKGTNGIVKIFNQIDYIICTRNNKFSVENARSYAGTATSTDHRLVVSRIKTFLWF